MRVFVTKWVSRYIRREGIALGSLRETISRAEKGLIDVDLGGGVIKQRVARPGKGRSGGYRMLIAYRPRDRAIFVFGFAKSQRENVEPDQLKTAREIASRFLEMSPQELQQACGAAEIEEVTDGY